MSQKSYEGKNNHQKVLTTAQNLTLIVIFEANNLTQWTFGIFFDFVTDKLKRFLFNLSNEISTNLQNFKILGETITKYFSLSPMFQQNKLEHTSIKLPCYKHYSLISRNVRGKNSFIMLTPGSLIF